ncbi:gp53-like domain-containing protein [Burkholderia vietnamiensis]|uniref:gp53-like domain-containing protein n=1 Tax=Burkholderia vietnamiensis TaxID=60552 RepID=UPI001592CE95|nr:hypothetical protein [Burkholderia vietnamiensis]
MADLVEASKWEEGIYQLETSDPVEGGPDGVDNVQARQLGNRTRYLKDQQEAHVAAENPHPQYATVVQMKAAIEALVASAPGALDTLKELADALGDDPNFATTMTNALALKAALDSPEFSGVPKAPTPPQFDNSKRLVTSEFVRSVGMQASAFTTLVGATTLTAAHAGSTIYLGGAGNYVVTLPRASTVPAGARIEFVSGIGSSPVTIARQATDSIYMNANTPMTTVPMALGDTFIVESNGLNWYSVGGSTPLAYTGGFGASIASPGYQKLPSGMIIQSGNTTTPGGTGTTLGPATANFPIAFPNNCVFAIGTLVDGGTTAGWTGISAWVSSYSATNLSVSACLPSSVTSSGVTVGWIAFGR